MKEHNPRDESDNILLLGNNVIVSIVLTHLSASSFSPEFQRAKARGADKIMKLLHKCTYLSQSIPRT